MNLKSLYKLFSFHPQGNWIMIWQNAVLLYEFIKSNQIKRVLDLGCGIGCSAAIASLALKEKGETDYHIDSIEQFDKCIKLADEIIPPELKENITIHKSEVLVWQTDKIPYQYFSVFETLPEGDYELIIQDGPGPMMIGEHYVDLPNGTITKMLLEDKLKAGTFIAWDRRIIALQLLERYFGGNFYLVKPAQNSDFNVIQRKDNSVSFCDDKLKFVKKMDYF